jgi:hypothetical protein
MSLATVLQQLETDVREGVQNAVNWLAPVADTNLPAAIAELKAITDGPVFKALEESYLTPAEEAVVAQFIRSIPSMRGQQAAVAAAMPLGDPADGGPLGIDTTPGQPTA